MLIYTYYLIEAYCSMIRVHIFNCKQEIRYTHVRATRTVKKFEKRWKNFKNMMTNIFLFMQLFFFGSKHIKKIYLFVKENKKHVSVHLGFFEVFSSNKR